ncbi:unnamed protein product [Cuscuta campestris]|uniref:Uncharacterized protein n=1 Tax=Cuscuta campestris TaxID=132261 RepID=A0A484M4Y9_9ASTE|nr:unnamed protein product [Cuscuta campestris]
MEGDRLLGHHVGGKKRKRETAHQGKGKRPSSSSEDHSQLDQVVIELEDQDEETPETGMMATSSLPQTTVPESDLVGSSRGPILERPPSPPMLTYEVATEGGSTKLSIPHPSPSLGDVQLETLITLPAHDRARISASSYSDLANMVLLKLGQLSVSTFFSFPSPFFFCPVPCHIFLVLHVLVQASLVIIELAGRAQDHQYAPDEMKEAAEPKQKDLQDEVARLARELTEEKKRSSNLAKELSDEKSHSARIEEEKTSLSSEVGFISARVVELEGEKVDLVQQLEAEKGDPARRLEEGIEAFKTSPSSLRSLWGGWTN